jgi:hypothetical protein
MTTAVAPIAFRWEEPPPTNLGRRPRDIRTDADAYTDIAARLRVNPGRWAVIAEFGTPGTVQASSSNLVDAIRRGRTPSWSPAGSYEATARKRGNITTVYARYLQPQS